MSFFNKKENLKAEISEIHKEKEEVQNKTPKIDKLSKELHNHLKENNIGQRLYDQMVQSWR